MFVAGEKDWPPFLKSSDHRRLDVGGDQRRFDVGGDQRRPKSSPDAVFTFRPNTAEFSRNYPISFDSFKQYSSIAGSGAGVTCRRGLSGTGGASAAIDAQRSYSAGAMLPPLPPGAVTSRSTSGSGSDPKRHSLGTTLPSLCMPYDVSTSSLCLHNKRLEMCLLCDDHVAGTDDVIRYVLCGVLLDVLCTCTCTSTTWTVSQRFCFVRFNHFRQ